MPVSSHKTVSQDHSKDWRKKNEYYHALVERYLTFSLSKKDSLLVLGCGEGHIFDFTDAVDCVGVDINSSALARAKQHLEGKQNVELLEVSEYASLPDWHRVFDVVVLYDILAELADIQAVLDGIRRFVTPRSRVVLNFHSHLWSPVLVVAEQLGLKRLVDKPTWVTTADLLNFSRLSDYEVVVHEQFMLVPKRLLGLGPLINRWLGPLPFLNSLCLENVMTLRPLKPWSDQQAAPVVSVLVPARNEVGNIESVVSRMPSMGARTELIFVEGHSHDATWEEIKRVQASHPEMHILALQQLGRGKGDAVRFGFSEAKGDILMILDADLTVAPEDLPKFYRAIVDNKGELINGCRLVYPMEKQAMRLLNMLANKFFGWLFTWLLGQRYRDSLCGTKVLWRRDYLRIVANRDFFGECDPFGDFDLIFGAARLGLKTIEVPIRYRERTYGSTNISRFRHGWLLLQMSLLAARRLKFKP